MKILSVKLRKKICLFSPAKVKILTCSYEVEEYGLDLLKRCLLGETKKTCFFSKDDCHPTLNLYQFTYEQWLVITASREDLTAVVFVSNN